MPPFDGGHRQRLPRLLPVLFLILALGFIGVPRFRPAELDHGRLVQSLDGAKQAGLALDLSRLPQRLKGRFDRLAPRQPDSRVLLAVLEEERLKASFHRLEPPTVESPAAGLLKGFRKGDAGCFYWNSPLGRVEGYLSAGAATLNLRYRVETPWSWPLTAGRLDPGLLDMVDPAAPTNLMVHLHSLLDAEPAIEEELSARLKPYHLSWKTLRRHLGDGVLVIPEGPGGLLVFHLSDPSGLDALLEKKLPGVMRGDIRTLRRQGATLYTALEDSFGWCLIGDYLLVALDRAQPTLEQALVRRIRTRSPLLQEAQQIMEQNRTWLVVRHRLTSSDSVWLLNSPVEAGGSKVLHGLGMIE